MLRACVHAKLLCFLLSSGWLFCGTDGRDRDACQQIAGATVAAGLDRERLEQVDRRLLRWLGRQDERRLGPGLGLALLILLAG